MISSNEERSNIQDAVISLLSSLCAIGFSRPVVSDEDWSTSITWMMENIGIELEIDWRDSDVFALVVRLENGKLPAGYYVSNGKPCRHHIQKLISDRSWEVDKEILAKISPRKNGAKQSGSTLIDQVSSYKQVIESCLDQIISEGDSIFLD